MALGLVPISSPTQESSHEEPVAPVKNKTAVPKNPKKTAKKREPLFGTFHLQIGGFTLSVTAT